MIQTITNYGFVILGSIWGTVYTGSLIPKLWQQKNYRGAIGMTVLACCTLILPTLMTWYGQSHYNNL
ncbi:hypothetical protein GCM10010916_32940 [Paenibacillus abyssi]|uniref:Uncharacterized protein n=1 Tax=Paenibacillus abyssi TaxID=1340531 RepID=A0A917FY12_9BACL|nr:hypothetical protein GCM10010916_32940 [Paenibacillus abyssi]